MPNDSSIAGPLHARLETLSRSAWSGAVRVHGTKDSGSIYLVDGRTVHAECGRVRGEFAYWLLMGMPSPRIELEAGSTSAAYTISRPLELTPATLDRPIERTSQPLRLEYPETPKRQQPRARPGYGDSVGLGLSRSVYLGLALAGGAALGALAQSLFSGPAAPPTAAPAEVAAAPAAAPRGAASARPRSAAADSAAERPAPTPTPAERAAAADRAAVADRAAAAKRGGTEESAPSAAAEVATAAPAAVDAAPRALDDGNERPALELSELGRAGAEPPRVIETREAARPASAPALAPEIVIRVRVDGEGRVAQADVYAPIAERAAFEQAALAAARGYRFSPARVDGKPVSVWLNLPVRVP